MTAARRAMSMFVTGTDTGVGKTTVACALAAAFRIRGLRVAVLKPVETGCVSGPDGLVASDSLRLAEAAGFTAPPSLLCPNRFSLAASPEVAAAAEGRGVDFGAIAAARQELSEDADLLLIEGAGGLLVPLDSERTMADLALSLGAPILIVSRASLGTVNHSLLTIEAARRRGVSVVGVVLNRAMNTSGPDEVSNAASIVRHGKVTVFGTMPHAPMVSNEALADLAERHLDLEGLWRALEDSIARLRGAPLP